MPINQTPPGQPNDQRVALVAPRELISQMRDLAISEGQSLSSEIRIAMREHLARASEEASDR
jgi:hypothetical protein